MIFKSTLVNELRSKVSEYLDKYSRNDLWVTEISTKHVRDLPTNVEIDDQLCLNLPDNINLKDTENAISIHKTLRHLTPLQASDPRLWTRFCHMDFWSYMRTRWPIEKHLVNQNRAVRFIESRYFVAQAQSRALLRNGMARLWWTAQLSHDSDRENPYELTEVLLSTLDVTQQILERGMGRADNILKGFLEFLLRNNDTLLTGGNINRDRIRRLAKHLNMYGGISVLDCLNKNEIMDLLNEELTRILKSESNKNAKKAKE